MSVAIRTVTDLKYLDDVNVSLGAGVDEYALCWDNDTARFVLRAVATGGLLATGATVGATSQRQAFTNGISGPSWRPSADSTTALQLQNAAGTSVLNVDTTNARVGIGTSAPIARMHVSDGNTPSAGLLSTDRIVLSYQSESAGSVIIVASDTATHRPVYKSIRSRGTLASPTAVQVNDQIMSMGGAGYDGAATHLAAIVEAYVDGVVSSGSVPMRLSFVTGTSSITRAERLTIKNNGLVGIGTTAPGSLLHGLLTSAATNVVTNVLTIGHDTTGQSGTGFGAGQLFALESNTTVAQSAARIQALWYEATHATRKADLVLTAYDSGGEREGLRIRGNGSAPAIAFLGATPAARVAHVADPSGGGTVDSEARSAINSILATLETFGLHATS